MYIRPLLSESECGDTGVILESEDTLFFSVLDVLGHGSEAYELAIKAKEFLEQNYREDMVELINELHLNLMSSRGLVGSLAKLDIGSGLLSHVGIGNITAKKFGTENYRFVNRDGIIGHKIPKPRVDSILFEKGDVFIMHSDGVRENSNLQEHPEIFTKKAKSMSMEVVQKFSRQNDDSTCFSLKYTGDL